MPRWQRATQRLTKRPSREWASKRTADHGIQVRRQWFKDYMGELGFAWTPTMRIGHPAADPPARTGGVGVCGALERAAWTYHYWVLSRPGSETGRFLAGLESVEQIRQEASFAGLLGPSAPTSHLEKREVAAGLTANTSVVCEGDPETSHPISQAHILHGPEGVDP
jgi:hypothetical protein